MVNRLGLFRIIELWIRKGVKGVHMRVDKIIMCLFLFCALLNTFTSLSWIVDEDCENLNFCIAPKYEGDKNTHPHYRTCITMSKAFSSRGTKLSLSVATNGNPNNL